MDSDQMLKAANAALFAYRERYLSDVETAIILGAIADQTYETIAEQSGYSINYLKRDIGPKLWRTLSAALGGKSQQNQLSTGPGTLPGFNHPTACRGDSSKAMSTCVRCLPGK